MWVSGVEHGSAMSYTLQSGRHCRSRDPFTPFTPPKPLPSGNSWTNVFTCVFCLFRFHIWVKVTWYLSWASRSIHVVMNGSISFCVYGWVVHHCVCVCTCVCTCVCAYIHAVCTYHIFCIHSSVSGHLGWFYILAMVNMLLWTVGCVYLFKLVLSFSLDK